jgi:hypothetical protein
MALAIRLAAFFVAAREWMPEKKRIHKSAGGDRVPKSNG